MITGPPSDACRRILLWPRTYELTALFDSLTISGQLRPWCIARLLWNEFNLCLRSNRFPCWLGAMRSNRMFPCGPDQYVNHVPLHAVNSMMSNVSQRCSRRCFILVCELRCNSICCRAHSCYCSG